MEQTLFPCGTGFNDVWQITENCRIVPAPYEIGHSTKKFFLRKRFGLEAKQTLANGGHRLMVFDDSINAEKGYAISGNKLYRFSEANDTAEDLGEVIHQDICVIDRDNVLLLPASSVEDGTADGADNPAGVDDAYLEDTSKSWAIDAYAGRYLFMKTTGDIQLIKGNSATKLFLYGWTNANAPTTGGDYGIYEAVARCPLLSSKSEETVHFLAGDIIEYVPTLSPFLAGTSFDGRQWYVNALQPTLVYYTEVGQPFIFASFIDTGSNPIKALQVFGDYLLIGTDNEIKCIRKDIDADGGVVYNTADIIGGLGVLSDRSFHVGRNGCFFVGSNAVVYTLSINVVSDRLQGQLTNISTAWGAYWTDFNLTDAYFQETAEELHLFALDTLGTGSTRLFKFIEQYQGWLVDNFAYAINDAHLLFGQWYQITNTGKITTLTASNADLGEAFNQRVGALFGLDSLFATKFLHSLSVFLRYLPTEHVLCKVTAKAGYTVSTVERTLVSHADSNPLGEDAIGANQLGGESTDNFLEIQLHRMFISRTANLFEIIFDDEGDVGFTIGDMLVFAVSHGPLLVPKSLAV